MQLRKIYIVLTVFVLQQSCINKDLEPWIGPLITQPRNQLTVEQLKQNNILPLTDMSFFAKPNWAQSSTDIFSGTISFNDTKLVFPKERESYPGENIFPGISIDFISNKDELIPLNKNLIITDKISKSYWDIFIGTGAVWYENEDKGWNRGSFPLTLTDRFMGQARNCVATFVYKKDSISNICVQCSQETANLELGQIGDIRTLLNATYKPKEFTNILNLIESHEAYKLNRLQIFPLNNIDNNYELADYFNKTAMTNAPTSLGAIMFNGKLYIHPPKTRHGLYPYPNEMRHSIFSATKSMAGSLSLLYFSQRYNEDVFNKLITDYVPILSNHPGWQGVTFSNTLNMVTGTLGSEQNEHFKDILVMPRTAEACINNIAKLDDAIGKPGEIFNYGPTNTFVLSYALQKYVESKEGKSINYWDLVHDNVLVPIGAEFFSLRQTIESNEKKGIPLLSYGATPTLDEAAKIALLFLNEGNYMGQQLLHKQRTREALGLTNWKGYSTNNDFRGSNYHHGFWSKPVKTERCNIQVTYMLGYGENYVLFLPSNIIVFRFMDEHDLDFSNLIRIVEKIKSSCN